MKHLTLLMVAGLGIFSAGCADLTSPSPITITKENQAPEVARPTVDKAPNPTPAQPTPGGVMPVGKRGVEGAPVPAAMPAAGCGG